MGCADGGRSLSARLQRLRELSFQHREPPLERLALDLRIGDLGVLGEAAEQMALGAVEIGSGLMAARSCGSLAWDAWAASTA